MKRNFLIIITVVLIAAVKIYGQENQISQQVNTQTKFTYKIIEAVNHAYGYDVYANDKLLIHQTSIPSIPGNKGFTTKKDAAKVAQLVVQKLKSGIMPPSVTREELEHLKI